jgi:hypothetical protein
MIWLLVSLALAEPCTESSPITAGETAPCDGLLLPSERVRELLLVRDVQLPELRAEFELRLQLADIQTVGLQKQLELERETLGRYRELLDNPPRARLAWWEHPAFWGAVGLAAGVGVGVHLAVR